MYYAFYNWLANTSFVMLALRDLAILSICLLLFVFCILKCPRNLFTGMRFLLADGLCFTVFYLAVNVYDIDFYSYPKWLSWIGFVLLIVDFVFILLAYKGDILSIALVILFQFTFVYCITTLVRVIFSIVFFNVVLSIALVLFVLGAFIFLL